MYLTFRQAEPKDLKDGFQLIADQSAYSTADQPRLFSFWRYILKKKIARTVVVEDREMPVSKRMVGFAISLFISDDFSREIKNSRTPPFSYQVFQNWLKGSRVFLTPKEIASHNSKGDLNLVSLHYGWKIMPEPELAQVRTKMLETLFLFHAGYRIKEFFMDVFGQENAAMILKQGFFLFSDYENNLIRGGDKKQTVSTFLVGANRQDTHSKGNQYIWSFLNAPIPRFGFSQGEKEVLEKAFLGETDKETARSLHLSIWAIKKRWQGIYGKTEKSDTHLFAQVKEAKLSEETQKVERRRYLLEYLRNHLEEIRPTLKPSRRYSRPSRKR